MLFLSQPHELDNNAFLVTHNKTYSYNDIFKIGDTIFPNRNKEIVLILCDKDVETITSYVATIRHNKIPLLVDKNYKLGLILSFIENYQPNYILSSSAFESNFEGYTLKIKGDFYIYSRDEVLTTDIYDELALLIPTSGSTGDPKCVRISDKNIDTCTQSICEYLDFDESRVSISVLPIHYSFGLSVLHNTIFKRSKYVISKSTILDKEIWDDIEKFGVTDFSCVPFIMKIMKRIKLDFTKISTLKYVTQAGGYLPEKDSIHFYNEFSKHGIKYFTMYGQTEASPRISYLGPEFALAKSGSAGKAISCGRLSIGEAAHAFGTGELRYEGPNVALGYAESKADLIKGDEFKGVLMSGDIVELDHDGFIKIVGRKKRFIKISGKSVSLDRIEKDIIEFINNVAVVGKDDKLVIVVSEQVEVDLKKVISEKYGFIKSNVKIAQVPEVPLNPSGKIDYKLLNEQFCE